MARILITGAGGFLGGHLVVAAARAGDDVTAAFHARRYWTERSTFMVFSLPTP
jgi:nucleoside-diphosphate-sugar epimerase